MSVNNCGDKGTCYDLQSCDKVVRKSFDVSVPVTITPFARPEKPEVKCSGEIVITPGHKCCENESNSFEFTVTQRINVDIPVKFGAEVCFFKTCAADKCGCEETTEQ
jgi:hypothetical protein